MKDLIVDEERGRPGNKFLAFTGINVRATRGGEWGAYDIATLELGSLREWLRSRGGENRWAENVVAVLLEHTQDEILKAWGGL